MEQVLELGARELPAAPLRDLPGERRCGGRRAVLGRARAPSQHDEPVWVTASAVATARFDDGCRAVSAPCRPRRGRPVTARRDWRSRRRSRWPASAPTDLDFVELQDNTVYYELAFPEDWGLCKPGEAESLVRAGETLPTGRLPINPSGGFLCFGEATTAHGRVPGLRDGLAAARRGRAAAGTRCEARPRSDPGPRGQRHGRSARTLTRASVEEQMSKDPLRTKLCDMLGIEYPIIAFTHCKDVAVAVINAGGFAVLGEAMHTPDEIAADVKWIRARVGGKPFGIDLVLPASVPAGRHARRADGEDPGRPPRLRAVDQEEVRRARPPKGPIAPPPVGRPQPGDRARASSTCCSTSACRCSCSGLGSPAFILERRARARHQGLRPDRQDAPGQAPDRGRRRRGDRAGLRRRGPHRRDGHLLDRPRGGLDRRRHAGDRRGRRHHRASPRGRALSRRRRRVDRDAAGSRRASPTST